MIQKKFTEKREFKTELLVFSLEHLPPPSLLFVWISCPLCSCSYSNFTFCSWALPIDATIRHINPSLLMLSHSKFIPFMPVVYFIFCACHFYCSCFYCFIYLFLCVWLSRTFLRVTGNLNSKELWLHTVIN